jgi:hypothetical protein
LAIDKAAGSFFRNGLIGNGIYIKTDKNPNKQARETLKDTWADKALGAVNAGLPPILPIGMELASIATTPEAAQFLDQSKWVHNQICAQFRMNPLVIDPAEGNYNASEWSMIFYIRDTLRPHLIRWEQEVNRKLFLESEKGIYYGEMEVDALQRGDLTTQDNSFEKGRRNGWYSTNDIRRFKNLPEIEGGDDYSPLGQSPQPANAQPPADPGKPGKPAQPPASPAQEDPSAPPPEDRIAPVIKDAARRVATKISKALERTKQADSIWLERFLGDKQSVLREALLPCCQVINPAKALWIADEAIETIREQLPKELEDAKQFDAMADFIGRLPAYIEGAIKEQNG